MKAEAVEPRSEVPFGPVRPIMMVLQQMIHVARGDLSDLEWERLKPLLPADYRRSAGGGTTVR